MSATNTNECSTQEQTQKWNKVCGDLYNEFGRDIYNVWISNLDLVSLTEFEITMSVPTAFIRDWILREYFDGKFRNIDGEKICIKKGIKQVLLETFTKLVSFQIVVDRSKSNEESSDSNTDNVKSISQNNNLHNIGIQLNENYTFENYVVGDSNRLAYHVAKNIATSDKINQNTNPLFMYGGVGLGKTHLCQSIAWKIKETQPNKRVVYLSAEKFMFLFVQSLQEQDINTFKNRLRNIDILIIDDIQFIVGKDKTQKEFLYTFETLVSENKQVVLACDKSPINLIELDEKLKSRINGGLVVDIKEPDYKLRLDIVKNKCQKLQLNLDEKLMEYIAEKIISNGREIEGCLKRLQLNQNVMNMTITKDDVNNILHDNIVDNQKIVTFDTIQKKVADYFKISITDLKSSKRIKELVMPRHIAMYLCRKLTEKSFPDVAKAFNCKNHATVVYAVNKINDNLQQDAELALNINNIRGLF